MTEDEGWFVGVDADDTAAAAERIRTGRADGVTDWPSVALESGFVDSTEAYYDSLHEATVQAARAAVRATERADDQQLIHAVRAMDDCRESANELAERVSEWGGSRHDDAGTGVAYARRLVESPPDEHEDAPPAERRLRSLAGRVVALDDEADSLRGHVETTAPTVAPNLSMLAGPVLAARLISLAGGLETLAKQPSSTVQLLGAEDALFAHLEGSAPSPKHGVIYTHEYVSGTRASDRGSAARALAGKLTIAARIDHYSGDRRPELQAELDERMAAIRGDGGGDADAGGER